VSNIHRIQWIDSYIRNNQYPNCSVISEKFEISKRQASRDIEYLKYSLNAPVEYSAKYNGYYYKDKTYLLPFNIVTSKEKKTLEYLEDNYRAIGNERALAIADLFSRISGRYEYDNSNQNSTINYRKHNRDKSDTEVLEPRYQHNKLSLIPADINVEIYSVLKNGADLLEKVEIEYIDARFNKSIRIICPYKIFLKYNQLYVVGFCDRRKALRVFSIKRILKAIKLSQKFSVIETFNPNDYGEQKPFLVFKPYFARVVFNKQIDLSQYTIGKVTEVSNEENKYELEFRESHKLLDFLFTSQKSFEIISPNWLKQRLVLYLKEIFEKNS